VSKVYEETLNEHIQHILSSENNRAEVAELLKSIQLMLEIINDSDIPLSDYSEMEALALYAKLGEIAVSVQDFYDRSKNVYDPAIINDEFKQTLDEVTSRIKEKHDLVMSLEKNNAELLLRQPELQKLSGILSERQATISVLEKVKDVTDADLSDLASREKELSVTVETAQRRIEEYRKVIPEYEATERLLSETVVKEDLKKRAITETILSAIKARYDTVKQIYEDRAKELAAITEDIETYCKQHAQIMNQLPEKRTLREQHKESVEVNQRRLAELEEEIRGLEAMIQTLTETIIDEDSERQVIEETILATIESRRAELQRIYEQRKEELTVITDDMKSYLSQYQQLKKELPEMRNLYNRYKLYLRENSNLIANMETHGVPSVKSYANELDHIGSVIADGLSRYDEILSEIIVKQADVAQEIKEMQRRLSGNVK
jgi:chromosome segregation ATPase